MIAPLTLILVALVAMLGLISVRRLELARGMRFFDTQRSVLDARAAELWEALVLGGLPVSWRAYVRAVFHDLGQVLVHTAVEVVRAVERPLAKLSYKMRVTAPKSGTKPVSDFLKTITPEKK